MTAAGDTVSVTDAVSATGTVAAGKTVPVWVLGARGMLAGELLRLLELHPALALGAAVSREPAAIETVHPHLARPFAAPGTPPPRAMVSAEEAETELEDALARGPAALVLALPHGESGAAWKRLRSRLGARARELAVVDLAADHRLADPELYRATYGRAHPDPAALATFVYGLPELHRERIRGARRVAAPGCFATALQLAALPAARAGVLAADRPWIFSGVTGSSGSGSEPRPTTHHPWRHGNLRAYSLAGHRHEAELAQALAPLSLSPPLCFVPHSGPFARGIHLTAFLPLARSLGIADARALYDEAYAGEPFVRVLGEHVLGEHLLADDVPDLRCVSGSNSVQLALSVRSGVLQVLCTLDNLVKGGAGQALQCLNLMLGFPETWGLARSGMGVS